MHKCFYIENQLCDDMLPLSEASVSFVDPAVVKPRCLPIMTPIIGSTLPETNSKLAPENGGPLEKEIPIGKHHF